MRTAGWLVLSAAIVAGLTVAASRAAEEPPAGPTTPPSEANAPATVQPPASTVPVTPKDAAPPPSVTIIGASDAHGVLGHSQRFRGSAPAVLDQRCHERKRGLLLCRSHGRIGVALDKRHEGLRNPDLPLIIVEVHVITRAAIGVDRN